MIKAFEHWSGPLFAHVSLVKGDPDPVIRTEEKDTVVQAVNAELADTVTLVAAVAKTLVCLERDRSPADKLDVAFLIHLSGERSFEKALKRCAPEGREFVLVVGGRSEETVAGVTSRLLKGLEVEEDFPEDEKVRRRVLPRVSLPSLK